MQDVRRAFRRKRSRFISEGTFLREQNLQVDNSTRKGAKA